MTQAPGGADLREWIGREEQQADEITIAPLVALSATLDRQDPVPRVGDPLPPFWHRLFFLPRELTRELAPDGHPPLGGFLPPADLPRRMWAGSRLTFDHAPRVGESVRRVSRIADINEKSGSTGRLLFVAVQHEIHTPRGLAIREMQDLVYRDLPTPGSAVGSAPSSAADVPEAMFSRVITPDAVLLFRYSALTFNSHRIHYDRRHAMEVEGYPGLVVHGPLVATLLLDLLRREHAACDVREFTFKARRPLFDTAPFSVHGRADSATHFTLWALDAHGHVAVNASATIA
ncbi:MAG: MaoC family dehydratase N-terminal domain-containing protein [Gemmatimonadaceae bacterium]|nr:MaoC family dehydratase N-terminal domain-containing protein [Gemmatimonadaceae bacterium]